MLTMAECREQVNMELMQCDLAQPLPWRGSLVDTIVTFPPLGHRCKGVPDMEFLSNAFKVMIHILAD